MPQEVPTSTHPASAGSHDGPAGTQAPRPSLAALLATAAVAASGLALYSCFLERHAFEIVEQTLHLERLSPSLDGLRVVQLSDIHFSHFAEASYLRRVVAATNRLAPDLVLITGDFVSRLHFATHRYAARKSEPCAAILAQLACPHRWAVLGNHDALVLPDLITRNLEAHGIPVLRNRYASFRHKGARLWIAGIDSSSEAFPDLAAAVPPALQSSADPVVLLAHEPDFADTVVQHGGVDLMLAGHTHGGQVCLPLIGAPKLPVGGRRYVEGLFRFPGGLQLYVNRGVGAMKLPIRFRCRPEITLFTLRAGAEPAPRSTP